MLLLNRKPLYQFYLLFFRDLANGMRVSISFLFYFGAKMLTCLIDSLETKVFLMNIVIGCILKFILMENRRLLNHRLIFS